MWLLPCCGDGFRKGPKNHSDLQDILRKFCCDPMPYINAPESALWVFLLCIKVIENAEIKWKTTQKENTLMHKGLQVRIVDEVLKTVLFASPYHIVAPEILYWWTILSGWVKCGFLDLLGKCMVFNCSNITCINGHGRKWVDMCLYLSLSNIFHCNKLLVCSITEHCSLEAQGPWPGGTESSGLGSHSETFSPLPV